MSLLQIRYCSRLISLAKRINLKKNEKLPAELMHAAAFGCRRFHTIVGVRQGTSKRPLFSFSQSESCRRGWLRQLSVIVYLEGGLNIVN